MTDMNLPPEGAESNSAEATSYTMPVVFERDGRVFANSRDVAACFGKQHDNVLRDVRGILKSEDTLLDWFIPAKWQSQQNGQTYDAFEMTRDGFTLLVMGYTGPKAMQFKVAYIQQFNAMESALKNRVAGFAIPGSLAEALRLAADQADTIEAQKRQLSAAAPKVEAFNRLAGADGSTCITDAAKDLQIRPKALFDWLKQNKWIYSRPGKKGYLAYQDKIQAGYLKHNTTTVVLEDGTEKIKESVHVTPKGLAKLAQQFPSKMAAE